MCHTDQTQLSILIRQAIDGTPAAGPGAPVAQTADQGSRRKRPWELDPHAHCAIVGVCLPIAVLRRLLHKALGGRAIADDYELHCGAVAECKQRSAVAEIVQRELDRRYALALRQAAPLKTAEALADWWNQSLRAHDVAGPLWATLTHARCDAALARQVEGRIHMLQHQAGAATRADHERLQALQEQVSALGGELADATRHAQRHAQEHARRVDELEATVMQLRARLLARETTIATLQTLQAAAPELESRVALTQEVARLHQQCGQQQRALAQSQEEAQRQRQRADELQEVLRLAREASAPAPAANADEASSASTAMRPMGEHAVLCVGGRPASVPIYRQLIEKTGGSFLHHDGGEEDSSARLDATLAAADLVICQTGCISHAAYWRVKDHCKRTGKRCIFVESPSSTGLKRALLTLAPPNASNAPSAENAA